MLSVRCAIHLITVVAILKFQVKQIVWDSIPDNQFMQVLFRAAQVMCTLYFAIQAIKILTLVVVALVLNTTPLFTAVLGYFVLGDTLTHVEKLCLLISFSGVVTLVLG